MNITDREVLGTSTVDIGTLVKHTGLSIGQVQEAIREGIEAGYLLPGPTPGQWILTAPHGWRERRHGHPAAG